MLRRDVSKVLLATAAGSALLTQRASAQTCTAPCYPPASGENAASVANTAYPPGHISRYRAGGAPNDAAAVQGAFDSSYVVTGTRGSTYNCGTTTINVPSGARALLYGVKLHTEVAGTAFLNVTGNNVEIYGVEIEGRGNVSAALVDALIAFSGSSSSAYRKGLKVVDCHLHHSEFYGIYSEFGMNVEIRGCVFEHIGYAAVMALSAANWIVNENRIDDVSPGSSQNAYGIAFTRHGSSGDLQAYPLSIDCQACNNLVQNIQVWTGIDTHAGQRITFSENTIINCRLGINVGPVAQPTAGFAPADVVIANNIIHAGNTGSNAYRGIGSGGYDSSNRAGRILCTGNILCDFGRTFGANPDQDGAMMFQHTDGLIIAGNVLRDSRSNAICLAADNQNFLVTNNVVRTVLGGVTGAAGLNIRNSAQSGQVTDNYFATTAQIALSIAANSDVTFDRNRLLTSGTKISGAVNGGEGLELSGSTNNNRGVIASLGSDSFTITVDGAELGDECQIATSTALGNLIVSGRITAANTVTCVLFNPTSAAFDPGTTTYTAIVRKR
jgi:hypothetical protein